eukprot:4036248-Alexandrium_andersonii.AAC.1
MACAAAASDLKAHPPACHTRAILTPRQSRRAAGPGQHGCHASDLKAHPQACHTPREEAVLGFNLHTCTRGVDCWCACAKNSTATIWH